MEPKVESEPDFDKYYEIFKNPEMTGKEEMGQFTSLIKECEVTEMVLLGLSFFSNNRMESKP